MAVIQNWLPPSRENWQLLCTIFQYFPLITIGQWFTDFYPQGKTSIESRLNIPGKWAWLTMESTGFITLLYIVFTLPKQLGIEELPWGNWTMIGCYVIHYIYRSILSPLLLNPSMSPIHVNNWISAALFQVINAICFGGWLAGYGPTTNNDWAGRLYVIEVGLVIWGWGFLANIFHDEDLREIRRAAIRRQSKEAKDKGVPVAGVDKLYMLPKNGLFHWVLHAHYLCEWIEWIGFWMIGGWACQPARTFVINEVSTMTPRAVQGKRWYEQKFGKDKVKGKWAVIPGVI